MSDKIYFSPAEQQIIDVLRDREWHCIYNEVRMKDDRRRITDIRIKLQERGYDIESAPCKLHNHESRILMRRIVKLSQAVTQEPQRSPIPAAALASHQHMQALWNSTPDTIKI